MSNSLKIKVVEMLWVKGNFGIDTPKIDLNYLPRIGEIIFIDEDLFDIKMVYYCQEDDTLKTLYQYNFNDEFDVIIFIKKIESAKSKNKNIFDVVEGRFF